MYMCMQARARVHPCVCARARACVCLCVCPCLGTILRAGMRARVRMRVRVRAASVSFAHASRLTTAESDASLGRPSRSLSCGTHGMVKGCARAQTHKTHAHTHTHSRARARAHGTARRYRVPRDYSDVLAAVNRTMLSQQVGQPRAAIELDARARAASPLTRSRCDRGTAAASRLKAYKRTGKDA